MEAEINRLQTIISAQNRQIDELRTSGLTSEARQKLQLEINAAHANEKTLNWKIERYEQEMARLRDQLKVIEAENAALRKQLAELSDPVHPQSRPGRKPTVTDEMKAEIRARSDAGQSIRMIADEMGIGKSTVHRALQT